MPEGRVDKKYDQFDVLKAITPDRIRVSHATAAHITNIFLRRLYSSGIDQEWVQSEDFDNSAFESKIINEIRKAIVKGIVLFNRQTEDSFNPLDRQLEIYSYIDLKNIDKKYSGIAKLRIFCRLSLQNGTLSLRTIEKNFSIG